MPRTSLAVTVKIPLPGKPESQANQDGWWHHQGVSLGAWEVEWLQGDQKGFAKPDHAPAGRANAWGQGEVRVAGRPSEGHVGCSEKGIVGSCRKSQPCSGSLSQAGGGGKQAPWDSGCIVPRTESILPELAQAPERETCVNHRPQEGENYLQRSENVSFHLTQPPGRTPSLPRPRRSAPPPGVLGKLWGFPQRQASFWA